MNLTTNSIGNTPIPDDSNKSDSLNISKTPPAFNAANQTKNSPNQNSQKEPPSKSPYEPKSQKKLPAKELFDELETLCNQNRSPLKLSSQLSEKLQALMTQLSSQKDLESLSKNMQLMLTMLQKGFFTENQTKLPALLNLLKLSQNNPKLQESLHNLLQMMKMVKIPTNTLQSLMNLLQSNKMPPETLQTLMNLLQSNKMPPETLQSLMNLLQSNKMSPETFQSLMNLLQANKMPPETFQSLMNLLQANKMPPETLQSLMNLLQSNKMPPEALSVITTLMQLMQSKTLSPEMLTSMTTLLQKMLSGKEINLNPKNLPTISSILQEMKSALATSHDNTQTLSQFNNRLASLLKTGNESGSSTPKLREDHSAEPIPVVGQINLFQADLTPPEVQNIERASPKDLSHLIETMYTHINTKGIQTTEITLKSPEGTLTTIKVVQNQDKSLNITFTTSDAALQANIAKNIPAVVEALNAKVPPIKVNNFEANFDAKAKAKEDLGVARIEPVDGEDSQQQDARQDTR